MNFLKTIFNSTVSAIGGFFGSIWATLNSFSRPSTADLVKNVASTISNAGSSINFGKGFFTQRQQAAAPVVAEQAQVEERRSSRLATKARVNYKY
jgi:hypothetical protein